MKKHEIAEKVVDSVLHLLSDKEVDQEYLITLVNNAIVKETSESLERCAVSIVLVDELIEAVEEREFMSMMRFELEIIDREALIYRAENVLDDYKDYFDG
jgi:hypothetical protein